jgi:hypothetical protein
MKLSFVYYLSVPLLAAEVQGSMFLDLHTGPTLQSSLSVRRKMYVVLTRHKNESRVGRRGLGGREVMTGGLYAYNDEFADGA